MNNDWVVVRIRRETAKELIESLEMAENEGVHYDAVIKFKQFLENWLR